MSIIETVKGTIKATTNVVTGKTATVAFEAKGKLIGAETLEVVLEVTPAGAPLESGGAYVDLTGEDDLEETFVEKARELVLLKGDPTYTFEVAGPFVAKAGETKIITGKFTVPTDLDPDRKWFIRGRVQAFGKDPASKFIPIA